MADSRMEQSKELQQIVERVVRQVFDRQLPKLQAELVECVLAEMPRPETGAAPADAASQEPSPQGPSPNALVQAVASIHAGSTQKEILKGLLDAGTGYAARLALFVVKAGAATGWQARGLGDDDAIRDFPLDMTVGPAAHAYQNRIVAPANVAEMDRRFVKQFGGPENEQILMLPLLLKDKVAALLYADGGAAGLLDAASLEVLVMTTSAWLEVASLRKQHQKDIGDQAGTMEAPVAAPVQAMSSFPDPFASHAPQHVAVMTAVAPAAETPAVIEPSLAAPAPALQASPAVAVAAVPEPVLPVATGAVAAVPAADPFAAMSPEDADTHRKAQRFARLLVDEIKLYNQAKVTEGRHSKDLYDRLKDDIEKSRQTYQKRYGTTVAANADYFQKEVIRNLAEEDVAVMGANFRR